MSSTSNKYLSAPVNHSNYYFLNDESNFHKLEKIITKFNKITNYLPHFLNQLIYKITNFMLSHIDATLCFFKGEKLKIMMPNLQLGRKKFIIMKKQVLDNSAG
jgi:hypothetical protein